MNYSSPEYEQTFLLSSHFGSKSIFFSSYQNNDPCLLSSSISLECLFHVIVFPFYIFSDWLALCGPGVVGALFLGSTTSAAALAGRLIQAQCVALQPQPSQPRVLCRSLDGQAQLLALQQPFLGQLCGWYWVRRM